MWLICWLGYPLRMFSRREVRSLMLKNLVCVCVCVIGTHVNQTFQLDLSELSPLSKHAPNTKRLVNLRGKKKTLKVEQWTFLNQRTPVGQNRSESTFNKSPFSPLFSFFQACSHSRNLLSFLDANKLHVALSGPRKSLLLSIRLCACCLFSGLLLPGWTSWSFFLFH